MMEDKQLAIGVIKDLLVVPLVVAMIFTGAFSCFNKLDQKTFQTPRAKTNHLEQKVAEPRTKRPKMTEKIYQQALEMDKAISENHYIKDIPLRFVPKDKLVQAVIKAESNGYSKVVSKMGAKGKMQIMPGTLREYNQINKTNYTEEDLMNPTINEKIGRWYLFKRLPEIIDSKNIPKSLYTLLVSYNRGAENVKKWLANQKGEFHTQPKETQNYVKKIYADLGFSLDV